MPGPRRVLIVDDDSGLRAALRARLEMLGLEVLEADDGSSAVNLADAAAPDLIITDVNMPGFGSGLDAVKAMRTNAKLHGVPIIVLTGMDRSRLGKVTESGKVWVFQKPPNWDALMETVTSALAMTGKP